LNCDEEDEHNMTSRLIMFSGAVAVLIGVIGLFAPVSVSPETGRVGCGSAAAPDLSAARAHDDGTAANIPVRGAVVVDTNYTRLCHMDLADRRIWTITLAGAGALAAVSALALMVITRDRR
jgi:hypothetical protein